jgi:hypothetical protein
MNYSLLCEQYRSSQPLSRTSPNEIYLKKLVGIEYHQDINAKNYQTMLILGPVWKQSIFVVLGKKTWFCEILWF